MRLPLALAAALLAAPALAQDTAEQERDRGFLTGLIEDNLSSTARQVVIEGFEGALSSRATVERLTVADAEGVWLDARDLVLDWDRSAVLGGRIEIEELAAGSIAVLRAPVPDPDAADLPSPEATPFSLPELPVSVRIGRLDAERIALGEPLLGQELVLNLEGSVNLAGGEGEADIRGSILEGSEGSLVLAGSFSNESRVLDLNLTLEEAANGLVARALDLPGRPALALSLAGTAPIDDYAADFRLATDGAERVAGAVALKTTQPAEGERLAARAFGLDVGGDVTALVAPDLAAFFGPEVQLRTKGIRRGDGSLVLTSLDVETAALDLQGSAALTAQGWPQRIALDGTLGTPEGAPVALPGAAGTTVQSATLDVSYDRAAGDAWTGAFEVVDLARPGLDVAALSLDGSGTIQPAEGDRPGRFTGDLAYAALGLALEDEGLASALGADLSGDLRIVRPEDGGPVRLERLTLTGPGVEAAAEGTVAGPDRRFLVQSSVQLTAGDLDRFAALAGLDLGGAANVTVVSSVRPLDGIFDLILDGTTSDLRLGIATLDPLLAGAGTVTVAGARDEAGTRIDRLEVATPALSVTGEADITSQESRARLALALPDLGLALPSLPGPAQATLDATRDSLGLTVLDAEADLPGATATLRASQPGPTEDAAGEDVPSPITLALGAVVEELSAFAPLLADHVPSLPVAPAGGAELSVAGTAAPDASTFDLALRADTRDLALGVERLDPLLAGAGSLSARAVRTGPLDLAVEDLRIDTALLDGTVSADIARGAATADLDLRLADVAPLLDGLSGPATLTGTAARAAEGATDLDLAATLPGGSARLDGLVAPPAEGYAFTGTADLDVANLQPFAGLLGRDLAGAADATVQGTLRPDLSTLDLQVDATGTDLRLGLRQLDPLLAGATRLSGRVARSPDGSAEVDVEAALAAGTARIDGALAPTAQGGAFTGDVSLDLPDLAPLSDLAGRPLGGALEATASGTAQRDLQLLDLSFDASSQDLRTGLAQLDPLLAGPGTASGTVARSPEGGLALGLVAATPLLDADVAGTFAAGAGDGRFDVRVAEVASLLPGLAGPASATGTATRASDGTVSVDADATAPGATASVEATVAPPAQGYLVEGTAEVAVADVAPFSPLAGRPLSGGLDATVSGSLLPSLARLDLAVDARAANLSPGSPALASLLAGEGTVAGRVLRDDAGLRAEGLEVRFPNLSVDADAATEGGATSSRFDARLADVGLFTDALSGPATAAGTATLAEGSTRLDADVTGPGGISARVSGIVAPTPDLTATGTAPLALLDPILNPRTVQGDAAFDLRLAGALTPEALEGTVTLNGARISDPGFGEALTGIDGTVALGGGTARADLTGNLLDGGEVAAAGTVALAAPFVADLRIGGDALTLSQPELYRATADLDLTVQGPLAGAARIAGLVDVATAEIRLPASGIGALGDLPELRHVAPSPAVATTLRRAEIGAPRGEGDGPGDEEGGFGLDLLVRAPTQVFVRGRGLDAELGGELRLGGTTSAILPSGGFNLIRGRLGILSQRFELTDGTATLQGDFVPFLRFVAETTARTGTLVRIILEGPANDPTVTFASTPELPQDEVLAQLIFGVNLASITPFQAVQLAAGVATLAGRGGGLIDGLRGDAGLADLDITTDEAGNPALRLGRYVSENVYTDVTVGTEDTEATINLDLTPDLTLRAGVSSEGDTSVGIEFARDY